MKEYTKTELNRMKKDELVEFILSEANIQENDIEGKYDQDALRNVMALNYKVKSLNCRGMRNNEDFYKANRDFNMLMKNGDMSEKRESLFKAMTAMLGITNHMSIKSECEGYSEAQVNLNLLKYYIDGHVILKGEI